VPRIEIGDAVSAALDTNSCYLYGEEYQTLIKALNPTSNFTRQSLHLTDNDILLIMFARLNSVSIALIALIGAVAATNDCTAKSACCKTSTIQIVGYGFAVVELC
jgi:hypothetical protein